jgi:TonB family protein
MSYKALLFCPDEASARLVTQVLSELDFTVELSFEPFVTVKKLSEEIYDALVVDCANEQNASVLFKGARSSTLNHSSLCVAVAEGQAGLANAFRIGANLVLTKPINIEQSKNTLRVARGLLRKNSPPSRGAGTPSVAATPSSNPTAPSASPLPAASSAHSAPIAPAVPAMAAPTPAPSMPSSLLEAEQKRSQSPSATPAASPFASAPRPVSTPSFGAGSAGFGAAPALAPERTNHAQTSAFETKTSHEVRTAAPLASHDTIVPETTFPARPEPAAPTFSSYAHRPTARSGGSKAVWIIPCLIIAGAAGFFGWKKYQPMQYLHARRAATSSAAGATSAVDDKSSPSVSASSADSSAISTPASSTNATSEPNGSSTSASSAGTAGAEGFPTKERIDISVPAETPERQVTAVAKPLQVAKKVATTPVRQEPPAVAPTPPALVITGTNPADSTIAGLVSTKVEVPTAAPATLRISQGITQGLLLKRVPPVYPSAALQLRREGTVEVLATIGKSGAITKVKVLSGDVTLAKAAVDAVKQWKYRPYLLNGEPVEIETQISMIFKMPH